MNWEFYKNAVKSLEGFRGMAGLMGGEPTLHPLFDRFTCFLRDNYGVKEILKRGRKPIPNFQKYITDELLKIKSMGRCLCSSMGKGYYQYFEIIQESFHYQLLNDHRHSGRHQGILISRKDVGITDDEWIPLRDACWLQNNWSASITPKGAFFCEVAATLDMLFRGPGGWAVEHGWWQRTPEEFGDQLKWCEICGIAIKSPLTTAKDGRDDVSPTVLEKFKKINSPKINAGKYKLFNPLKIEKGRSKYIPGKAFYLPNGNKNERIHILNRSVYPKNIDGIMFFPLNYEINHDKIKYVRNLLDRMLVVTSGEVDDKKIIFFESIDVQYLYKKNLKFGSILKKSIKKIKAEDWIVFIKPESKIFFKWRHSITTTIFNPGCLYIYHNIMPNNKEELEPVNNMVEDYFENQSIDFSLFNVKATSYKTMSLNSITSQQGFVSLWDKEKLFHYQTNDLKNCYGERKLVHNSTI
jgi:hypothetical protein